MSKKYSDKPYSEKVHVWGKISSITAIAALMFAPVAISAHYNAWPEFSKLFDAMKVVIPVYWISGIAEVFTYAPMLGSGGTYLSFVTGNITNLKMPCGLNAMHNAGVRANSEEGEVISTIAIASSAITTTVILAVGVLAFKPVLPMLRENELIAPAFNQVLPALFGALAATYFSQHWKISIFPILVGVITLLFASTMGVGTLIFVTIIASIIGAFVMFKLGLLDTKEEKAAKKAVKDAIKKAENK